MNVVKALAVACVMLPAAIFISDAMPKPAFAQQEISEKKVKEIQIALREFGFFTGKIDGKISKTLYAAMTKYTAYVRSKGWSSATGELTNEEVVFLLKQYEKRVTAKVSSESSNSSENSADSSSSGSAASETSGSGQSAGTNGGASVTYDRSGSSQSSASAGNGGGSSGAGAAP